MRYDDVLTQIRQAQATFTAAVQQAIGAADPLDLAHLMLNASGGPAAVSLANGRASVRKKSRKGKARTAKHWTQTPAGRKKMAAIARAQNAQVKAEAKRGAKKVKRGRTGIGFAKITKGRSEVTAFVVETVRAQQPIAKAELSRLMTVNGYSPRILGALTRHGYVYGAKEGYVLGPHAGKE